MQWKFQNSRAKIQIVAGGFGNGKTAALCIKFLNIAKRYPSANLLLGRSTYPKLNDTLRREFFRWCPKDWIKRMPTKDDNTCILKNNTTINFRYISQQGKVSEDGTTSSNLLSATYDAVGIDQMEDPEIGHKDFIDLIGRLRGDTRCIDTSDNWPVTGPRLFLITANPTRNWFYRKLIRPLHIYKESGAKTSDLLVDADTGEPVIDLFEGSTYENKENLAPDFIKTLENTYRGQMRDRYLLGQWAAYEGLVYPQFEYIRNVVEHSVMLEHLKLVRKRMFTPTVIEGYDFGMSRPSCYGLAFVDEYGNVCLLDGFHQAELPIESQARLISAVRFKYRELLEPSAAIIADPSIMKRQSQGGQVVGRSVANMFEVDHHITMRKGTNDIVNGISKVASFLEPDALHRNPFSGNWGSPHFFISSHLEPIIDEFGDYYWRRNTSGETEDKPMDRNDHGMDMIKYLLTYQPIPAVAIREKHVIIPLTWSEREARTEERSFRYG